MSFDNKARTGDILFWQLNGYFRISSRISSAVHVIDFEQGYDFIGPIDVSNEELGNHIIQAFDRSVIVQKISDLPKMNTKEKRKLYSAWERDLLREVGLKKISGLTAGQFRVIQAERDKALIRFTNCNCRDNPNDPRQYLPGQDGYQEFTIAAQAEPHAIAEEARKAFEACAT